MEPFRLMVATLSPKGEEAVVVASGSTVTSSKDLVRSLLMAALPPRMVTEITVVAEQADELLSTS